MLQVIRTSKRMLALSARWRKQGKRIGVVPTMGALHEGHVSLIRAARRQNGRVIVTVFVNPKQFGPQEDFRRYPRPFAEDVRACRAAGADVVFAPSVAQVYPEGFETSVDPGALARRWEGASRPSHFRGVATIVTILFEVTQPTNAYFGQKDYQQALILQRMAQDLRLPPRVHILPTVRETDGLAMSSRNVYLSPPQRREAVVLHGALQLAQQRIRGGERDAARLIDAMRRFISEAPSARVDYVAVVDAKSLEPQWRLRGRAAILLAVWIGTTRLIDNLLVDVP